MRQTLCVMRNDSPFLTFKIMPWLEFAQGKAWECVEVCKAMLLEPLKPKMAYLSNTAYSIKHPIYRFPH